MKNPDWTISDLLAYRDGEPLAASLRRKIETDAHAQRLLAQMRGLHDELAASAHVAVAPAIWRPVSAAKAKRGWRLRFPLATAASAFVASTLLILVLLREPPVSVAPAAILPAPQINPASVRMANLMGRSRDLELRLRGGAYPALSNASLRADGAAPSREERQLIYRIADVDAQIARLYEVREIDEQVREALWQRRVSLLENLLLLRGVSAGRLM